MYGDCGSKMMALGRQFSIGSVYNYVEDVVVPSKSITFCTCINNKYTKCNLYKLDILLWDPDDVARLAVVDIEPKETVRVHRMTGKQKDDEEDENVPWMSDLGLDDHSAVSLTAGLLSPSSGGAWQYAVDRANWAAGSFKRGAEVVVHCRRSSKKVSIDPVSQLEIVCRPEKIIKSQATHVVVAITYGQEAFCVFTDQKSDYLKMLDCAQFFADGLLNGRSKLEPDQDEEGDEEDGHQLIPLDLQCSLYSDSIGGKKGSSWTSKSVSEQYIACREVLRQQVKSVPLKVWLYPLGNLLKNKAGIIKIPTDVSRYLTICCHVMWDRLKQIRGDTGSLVNELDNLATQSLPQSICKRVKDFDGLMTKFASALLKALAEWTVSVRCGAGLKEDTISKMMEIIEKKSAFANGELNYWLKQQRQEIKALEMFAQLPGVRFVFEAEKLTKELQSGSSFAVVLQLPSLAGHSEDQLRQMDLFIDSFQPSSWKQWTTKDAEFTAMNSEDRRRIFTAVEYFSDWVTVHNSDTENVKYLVFYDERLETGKTSPFTRLWDCSSLEVMSTNFTIPKAPGDVTVDSNHRGVITLSWTAEETVELVGYLIQYQSADRYEEDIWESIQHPPLKRITISFLQSEESYVFRVAAVTLGGKSPFGPTSEEVTIDPVCPPPTGLKSRYVTDTSIAISWDHELSDDYVDDYESTTEDAVKVTSYSIDCWMYGYQESTFIQRSTPDKQITLEPLLPDAAYCVQIRAVCVDEAGATFYGPAGPVFTEWTLDGPERAAEIVRCVSQKCDAGPGIDGYKLPLKKHRGTPTPGVGHYVFGESSYSALVGKRRQRTILMLGATGSGKSTLINAMINYMLGIEWEDDFRFKLIDESADRSQAHSQTDLITTYDLYEMKDSRLEYSLTVVDTPGFGDTRGLEKDKEIMEQIQKYFQCRHGIQQLEAVCFVVQASLPRLTATQQYIFDSIMSIFGQDIKENIRLMVTFSDNALPPVLGAVKQAGIPSPMDPTTGLPLHHKFNNSIFFADNKKDRQTNEVNRNYFDMAVESFDRFFDDLSKMEAKSLTLTREVLEERKRLEALVEGLQMKTQIKLTRVDEFQQIKKILTENKEQMEANKDFEFEVEFLVPKSVDISRTGQFTTNCQKCRTTCHFPCRQASDENKHKCSVMDPATGNCRICNCAWNVHFNQKYRYEMAMEKVKRSSDAIRQQYQGAADETLTNEKLLENIQKEVNEHEKQLMELMQATYPCIQRLDEIALRPHPFSAPDYIDLMIAAEKQEHRPGYQQRIVTLQKLRQMAVITADLIREQQEKIRLASSVAQRKTEGTFKKITRRLFGS